MPSYIDYVCSLINHKSVGYKMTSFKFLIKVIPKEMVRRKCRNWSYNLFKKIFNFSFPLQQISVTITAKVQQKYGTKLTFSEVKYCDEHS